MNLNSWALGALSLAVGLGVLLLIKVLRGREPGKGIASLHGIFALTGVLLIFLHGTGTPSTQQIVVVSFLTVAAVGGLVMMALRWTGIPTPMWLALIHGFIALTGFLFAFSF